MGRTMTLFFVTLLFVSLLNVVSATVGTAISECAQVGETSCSPNGKTLYTCINTPEDPRFDHRLESRTCDFNCGYYGEKAMCIPLTKQEYYRNLIFPYFTITVLLLIIAYLLWKLKKTSLRNKSKLHR